MQKMIQVGDLIYAGDWDALNKLYPGCTKSFNDGVANPPPGMRPDPAASNWWESELYVRAGQSPTGTKYHFPLAWPDLKAAMQYSISNYGSMKNVSIGNYTWNVWGIGGIHLDGRFLLNLSNLEETLTELIHEPLHDFSQRGLDIGIFGGDHSTIQMIVGPTTNGYFASHNAFTALCLFLQSSRCDDGDSLWDKVIDSAGPPPTGDGITGTPPHYRRPNN
jgi:hypothetical protein